MTGHDGGAKARDLYAVLTTPMTNKMVSPWTVMMMSMIVFLICIPTWYKMM